MLSNSLTVEDEEAVQAELRELQLQTVCPCSSHYQGISGDLLSAG